MDIGSFGDERTHYRHSSIFLYLFSERDVFTTERAKIVKRKTIISAAFLEEVRLGCSVAPDDRILGLCRWRCGTHCLHLIFHVDYVSYRKDNNIRATGSDRMT